MFVAVEIADLPSTDKVYCCSDTGRYIKTRIVRLDDSSHAPELRAKNLFLHISGSACDADGWAIPDGDGGHCIAPEKSLTESLALIVSNAQANGITPAAQLLRRMDELRLECCAETLGIDDVIALKMAIPIKPVPTTPDTPPAGGVFVSADPEPTP